MFSEHEETTHEIVAKVIQRPEFVGTLHDSAMARALGYPAALVPGIDIYAYFARLTLATWGENWLSRGRLSSTSLRPVYDGDLLKVQVTKMHRQGEKMAADLVASNAAGVAVARGEVSIDCEGHQTPALSDFPVLLRPGTPPPGDPALLREGMRFSCLPEVVSAEASVKQVEEFLETSDLFARKKFIHPGYIQRLALRNAYLSFAHATPPIYVSSEGVNYSPAKAGERLEVSGVVKRLWERKGHHYMESEQLVIAEAKRAVMLIRRTTIYQARRAQVGLASTDSESRS